MSVKDFRTRDEIVVSITAGGAADAAAKKRRRGAPLPPNRPNDGILHRRKTGGVVRFFDLGWIRQGGVYAVPPRFPRIFTIADLIHPYDYTDTVDQVIGLGLANCYDLDQLITTFSDATPESTGFPIDLEILVGSTPDVYAIFDSLRPHGSPDYKTAWTSSGLKLPSSAYAETIQLYCLIDETGFDLFTISGPGHLKTTLSNNYSAPAVPFQLQPGDDVFIVPRIMDYLVFADRYNGGISNLRLQAIGRIIINPAAHRYMRDSPFYGRELVGLWGTDVGGFGGTHAYQQAYRAVTNGYLDSSFLVADHVLWPPATGSNLPNAVGLPIALHLEARPTFYIGTAPNRPVILIKRGSTIFYQFADE